MTFKDSLKIYQRKELVELIGYESRNKYEITTFNGETIAFAAEDGKSLLAILLRQFLGHWRTFEIHFYNSEREPLFVAFHPFRFYFSRLEITDHSGRWIGALQKRFSLLTKKFDLEDNEGHVFLTVASPLWRIWTFEFKTLSGRVAATIKKKWSGLLKEAFLDADNFELHFNAPNLSDDCKKTLLAAAIFIDLMYFEKRASR